MSSHGRHKGGFSLMEVLISLGIMSIALLSLVAVLVTGLRADSQSESRTDAQDFALQVMGRTLSELKDLPDDQAQDFWNGDQSSTLWAKGVETRNKTSFAYEIRCYRLTDAGGEVVLGGSRNQLKKIVVEVTWRDSTSGDEDSTLTIARVVNREI